MKQIIMTRMLRSLQQLAADCRRRHPALRLDAAHLQACNTYEQFCLITMTWCLNTIILQCNFLLAQGFINFFSVQTSNGLLMMSPYLTAFAVYTCTPYSALSTIRLRAHSLKSLS